MNLNEWTGTSYPTEMLEQATQWLGCLDSFVDVNKLKGEDSTSEVLEQSVKHLNYQKRIEFFEWLGHDARHQYAFADCCELWAKTSCIHSLKSAINKSNVLKLPTKNRSSSLQISPLMGESYSQGKFAPVWAYNLVIGLIVVGLSFPIIS